MGLPRKYRSMFDTPFFKAVYPDLGAELYKEISAFSQKEDHVVWYFRLMKAAHYLEYCAGPTYAKIPNLDTRKEDKLVRAVERNGLYMGDPEKRICTDFRAISKWLREKVEHFAGLANTNLPSLRDVRFNWRTPNQVFEDLGKLEEAWKEGLSSETTTAYGDKIIDLGGG
jgi:hypothetical protein